MTKPVIRIEDNGPYHIKGKFELKDDEGNLYEHDQDIILCRCGHSGEKPFCDGTHEEINFKSEPRANDLMVEV